MEIRHTRNYRFFDKDCFKTKTHIFNTTQTFLSLSSMTIKKTTAPIISERSLRHQTQRRDTKTVLFISPKRDLRGVYRIRTDHLQTASLTLQPNELIPLLSVQRYTFIFNLQLSLHCFAMKNNTIFTLTKRIFKHKAMICKSLSIFNILLYGSKSF